MNPLVPIMMLVQVTAATCLQPDPPPSRQAQQGVGLDLLDLPTPPPPAAEAPPPAEVRPQRTVQRFIIRRLPGGNADVFIVEIEGPPLPAALQDALLTETLKSMPSGEKAVPPGKDPLARPEEAGHKEAP